MDQENLILSLIDRGWYCYDSFLDFELSQGLLNELQSLPLKNAKVGKGNEEKIISDLRNDSIFWLDKKNESLAQNAYLEKMDELIAVLNRELFLGLRQFEGHFAKYEKNGFYKKHIDQFQGNKERLVSAITYLNTTETGGELRIYSRGNPDIVEIQIAPKAGRLVCFLSDQIYHEVTPTASERYSIAGWLRTTIP